MRKHFLALAAAVLLLTLGVGGYFYCAPTASEVIDVPVVEDTAKPLAQKVEFEQLAQSDPVELLHQCLLRYQREVDRGFRSLLSKQEWVNGKMLPPEEIELSVRGDVPNAKTGKTQTEVLMRWKSGKQQVMLRELDAILFSEKLSKDQMTTFRSKAKLFSEWDTKVTGNDAKGASRYCVRDAGLYHVNLRTYEVWKQHKADSTLVTEYLGRKPIDKLDGLECFVIKRTCKNTELDAFELGGPPETRPEVIERDGFTEVTVMIDAKNWLQVGTLLKRRDGQVVGEYYYRNLELNPDFLPETFVKDGLLKK